MPFVTPFMIRRRTFRAEPLHLLPTANVAVILGDDSAGPTIRFVMPHTTVVTVEGAAECAILSPLFVKCLLGPPRRFLGRVLSPGEHPVLAPFSDVDRFDEVCSLLVDLRASLTVTPVEADFIDLWDGFVGGVPIPTSDRTVERLCLRHAGQAPAAINGVARLARALDFDNSTGGYNGLGEYADASHYSRVCKAHTGRTPAAWRNLSQLFY
jgi:hypothetical protein